MHDPNFRRTVVLIAEHNEAGAMGVILNRPAQVTVAGAVPELEELSRTRHCSSLVFRDWSPSHHRNLLCIVNFY